MGSFVRNNINTTFGTTELFLSNGTSVFTGITTSALVMCFMDLSAMAAGDQYRFRAYERIGGGTQNVVYESVFTGAQPQFFMSPMFMFGDGWDFSLLKLAGTSRAIGCSTRTYNPDGVAMSLVGGAITSQQFGVEGSGVAFGSAGRSSWDAARGVLTGDGTAGSFITASTASTVTLATGDPTDDCYTGCTITLQDHVSPFARQVRTIVGYVGSTKVATVDRDFSPTPTVGSGSHFFEVSRQSSPNFILQGGLAAAGGASTITLSSTADGTNNTAYAGATIRILSGTGAGSFNVIKSYVAATKVATMAKPWPVTPDSTSRYVVYALPSGNLDASGAVDTNVTKWLATAAAAPTVAGVPKVEVSTIDANAITAASIAAGALTQAKLGADLLAAIGLVTTGTAQAGAATTITLAAGASATNNVYNGALCLIYSGTGVGEYQPISSYVGATKVATMAGTWVTTPDATSVYVILAAPSSSGSAPTAAVVAAAVWDELKASHTTAGTFGVNLDAAVSSRLAPTTAGRTLAVAATGQAGVDWANINAPTTAQALTATTIATTQVVASVAGAVGSVTGSVGGNVAGNVTGNVGGSVASIAAGGITAGSLAAGALSAIAAAVMAFVVEGSFTVQQYLVGYAAALFGKSDGQDTTIRHYRDTADTKNRITATTASTGRTAVTLALT